MTSIEKSRQSVKFAVIGLGGQGTGLVSLALNEGHQLLGAVDIGDKVGKQIAEFVDNPRTPDALVYESIDDLIDDVGAPDVVLIAASIPLEEEVNISEPLLAAGINVITLEADLFEPLGAAAERLDAAAKAGGATILATGIQDIWWLHLPALGAAANSRIERIEFHDIGDFTDLPPESGTYEAGIGLGKADFAVWAKPHLENPPVQGAPLRELARMLGFTPGETTHRITPIVRDTPVLWPSAERELAPGTALGALFEVEFPTEEGPVFSGTLRFSILDEDERDNGNGSVNSVLIRGDVEVRMVFPSFATLHHVQFSPVRRIPDVLAAAPGLIRAADLPAPRYSHPGD
ncbi:hypothetical protein ACFXG4_27440 [Nocardia sp. NPDC059246]|uniref:hypothetical protein n=1 Tax=unclassified Nocardia TaxID=2637762 RepID=UPI0036CAB156